MNDLISNLRLADLADVLIITVLLYWLIGLIRGTRAVQMVYGLLAVGVLYWTAQYFELYTLSWILSTLLSSAILILVVLFQSDIRRALTQVGRWRVFAGSRKQQSELLEEIVRTATMLAARRVGALLVLERRVQLNEYLDSGTRVDARVTRELLVSIFLPQSPIHDGAVIIREGRIVAAGCFLPLTGSPAVSKSLGSRHRAAIGVTEESDAVVVVISEEEGQISLVHEGRMVKSIDAAGLRSALEQAVSS